jgi:hypothetical protein
MVKAMIENVDLNPGGSTGCHRGAKGIGFLDGLSEVGVTEMGP